jgi:ubiquinone/menaquinone biosynthesis C-methylase UbiE
MTEKVPDNYAIPYNEDTDAWMVGRKADVWAGFFLPYLRPGMRLLDCGCGVGSITVGLAAAVAPGEAVGVDIEPRQTAKARELAERHGVPNARFEVGSVYELPFPDDSFDAAFEANVFEHLKEPLRALREMRRVLRPGGIVGLRDADVSTQRYEPHPPEFAQTYQRALRLHASRSSPTYAPGQRALLRQAGFEPGEAFTFAEIQATPESIRLWARTFSDLLASFLRVESAGEFGIEPEGIGRYRDWLARWPDEPDALRSMTHFAAIGRVRDQKS